MFELSQQPHFNLFKFWLFVREPVKGDSPKPVGRRHELEIIRVASDMPITWAHSEVPGVDIMQRKLALRWHEGHVENIYFCHTKVFHIIPLENAVQNYVRALDIIASSRRANIFTWPSSGWTNRQKCQYFLKKIMQTHETFRQLILKKKIENPQHDFVILTEKCIVSPLCLLNFKVSMTLFWLF
jgi:hypothetical protein